MELIFKVVVVGLVIGALWWAFQPRYTFVVRIEKGVPRLTKGKVTATFLQEVGQACAEGGIVTGWVGGVRRGRQVTLACSRRIPVPSQQRLRNLWMLHG
jgi:hypothetical protein